MDELSVISCETYRDYVREIRLCTVLPLRDAGANWAIAARLTSGETSSTGGVESLRAIRRIFARTQNRLMLPAAGRGYCAAKVVEDGKQSELEAMCRDWPFFSTRLGMLEMGVLKSRPVAGRLLHDQRTVAKTRSRWARLRDLLEEDVQKWGSGVANDSHLMADFTVDCRSIQLNVYTDPLNVLQAELLYRSRLTEAGQIAHDLASNRH